MAVTNSITEKKYKKLILQVSLNGFFYCIKDTLNHNIDFANIIDFSNYPKSNKVEDHFWRAFLDNRALLKTYDEIVVLHDNNWNSFVPKALFNEEFLSSYLQFNTKVFETDFLSFDSLLNYEMNNVFLPYLHINNYLLDQFESFNFYHVSTILVEKLLLISKNIEEKQVFVHFGISKFEIIVAQNQKLLFFNSFEFQTKEDFIYYLLFTVEQLNLNPENFKLQLLGEIDLESVFFKIAFQYVRNVSLLDISDLQQYNAFSTAQNLKHFILFQT
jgi:hypothetical protein